jgi:superfamily II DNA or RNA helicase
LGGLKEQVSCFFKIKQKRKQSQELSNDKNQGMKTTNSIQLTMFEDLTKTDDPKALILREYQALVVEKILALIAAGINPLLYLPTGAGKTECAVEIARQYIYDIIVKYKKTGKKVCFVCNRTDLINQTVARFKKYGFRAGVIQANVKHTHNVDVYVLSIDSFSSRQNLVKSLNFGLVIIDEAHNHFNKRGYVFYQSFYNTDTVFLGLTATPFLEKRWELADGLPEFWLGDKNKPTYKNVKVDDKIVTNYYYKSFGYIYDEVVVEVTPSQLKAMKFLSECEIRNYDLFDPKTLKKVEEGEEYNEAEVFRIFSDPSFLDHAASQYLFFAKDGDRLKQGLAFCVNIAHAKVLTNTLLNNGIRTKYVTKDTSIKEREKIYEDYRNYEIDVICSVDVFCEGFDMPQAEICLLCKPTNSLIRLVQIIGRMLRIFPGKEKCVIIDQGNSTQTIVSKYLELPCGFSPYDPLDLSPEKILAIDEPPLPREIEEKLNSGGGYKQVGILGDISYQRLSYAEQRAQQCVKYAKEHNWTDKQLVEKFVSTNDVPCMDSIQILVDHINNTTGVKNIERYTEILYHCCIVYNFVRSDLPIPEIAKEKLSSTQIEQVSKKAKERRINDIKQRLILQRKSIVVDYEPPHNSYYQQLKKAALKGGTLVNELFHNLFSELQKRYLADQSTENKTRLDKLKQDYVKIVRKYKRAAKSDQKI